MTDSPVFTDEARAALGGIYPERPGILTHRLAGHPLFTLEALIELAARMRPIDVEQNIGDLPVGIDPAEVRHNGLSIADTIRSIEQNGSWMVLKFVEQDPAYRALLEEILAEIEPLVARRTGAMIKREGFIFLSSPNAVTPFHFDPEHNILLQLRGCKTMTVFPAGDAEIAHGSQHEAFHRGGHRNLPFQTVFETKGRSLAIGPGEAVYVPVKAPHWVRNGPDPSISFSVTWRSEWSYREEDAHSFNHLLRRMGLDPALPGRFPRQNRAKSFAWRAIRRARRVLRRNGG
ncbi:cupin domain-containing protein [Flavisphingomonas formosensis]|uniref:cupin-like domain-containing protein n=1 Tax=Flavisphingomonas formosensis TaxID=861534 RepID=UPI0012FCB933|nr:cupin-like domain-containing protein [Sphingomonas formosensis]